MITPHAIEADIPLNLRTTLGVSPSGFWELQNRTPSWVFLREFANADTPDAEDVALGFALQTNEHRTVAFKTDLDLWALARIGGNLVAGDA